MDKIIWMLLVFAAGAFLPVQAGLNAKVGKELASASWASLISFAVGLAALFLYVLLTKQKLNTAGIQSVPMLAWTAGLLGAFYVTVILLAFPRIGATLTFGLIVGGQLLISVLLDHFKILVATQQIISWQRVAGLLCILVGVILIRKF